MDLISWSDARRAGLKRYFTGEPCHRGHVCERYVLKCACVECERERLAKLRRRQLLERGGRPWSSSDEERAERRRAALKRYRDAHPERVREASRAHQAKYPERRRAARSKWAQSNPDAVNLTRHRRRARKVGVISKGIVALLLTSQRGRCANCRCDIRYAYEVDHIVPLAAGGAHADENLQLLCGDCNRRKGAKDPIRWAQEQGRLI